MMGAMSSMAMSVEEREAFLAAVLKAKLLAKAGRFSLCVQSEMVPYRYVSVEGPIVETRQVDRESDVRVMARRYLGKELGDQYVEDGNDESMICVSMRPETWYTVDYGKTAG